MPVPLDDQQILEFLAAGSPTAHLATVRPDGRPHVVPIWFVLDGDDIVFNTGANTVKGRNIMRTGEVSICVDDERPPFAFVMIDGTADVSEDPGELLRWATRIGGRYMGADRAEEFGRRNAVPGELLVRVTPTRVTSETDVAGYA